jgi:[ribosomal protein S5]-alanine N-acetyltransferase
MIYLETDRLIFRDHAESDLEAFLEIESDPEYRWPLRVFDSEALEKWFRKDLLPARPMQPLATVFKAENRYIGRCGLFLHPSDDGNYIDGDAQIEFFLARPFWGRGLATEAGFSFIQHGFQKLHLNRIELFAATYSVSVIRVAEELGFHWYRTCQDGDFGWNQYQLRNPPSIDWHPLYPGKYSVAGGCDRNSVDHLKV